jgi:hypothetical protein
MDLQAAKTQNGPKWVLARIGILALFLLTGFLLVASLNTKGSLRADASSTPLLSSAQPALATDKN